MAIDLDQSHYSTGTAAVSGTAVTGTGTAWVGAVRKGDLYGTHKGQAVRIAAVNSNTSLTLAYAVTALNQAAGPYEIQRTPYDLGYQQAIEDLVRLLGDSGNLPDFAALVGTGGNLLPYFVGAGDLDVTAFTAFARTLLDDANASTVLSTLGVSTFIKTLLDDTTAATARTTLELLQVQTDTQDSTVDRLLRTGAFGLGTTGAPTVITNFNTVVAEASGLYAFASGASNGPPDSFTGVLLVLNNSATARTQVAMSATGDGVMWMRKYSGGAWSTWKPVTPQFITNSNGVAWRFANGLQICLRLTAFSVDVSTAATGAIFQGNTSWTFPAEFTSGSVVNAWSIAGGTSRWGGNATGVSGTGCTLRHFAGATSATGSNLFGVAIGQYT